MNYAFTFDARACSGCKACQEACKDKNQLPVGVLWRRLIEVSGGDWQASGNAWENNVFAYHLSLACNHCTHPKCAGVCPTEAYKVRPDGIVLIDISKCMGCGYCAWACPYGVPQYDNQRGVMTKCDFCYDSLDAGLSPSCVAACPLRVLDYSTTERLEITETGQNLWQLPASQHPYPLPVNSRTEPHLAIKLHAGMDNRLYREVSNQEEILAPTSYENNLIMPGLHELPLVAFTLLLQMAAGMAVYSLAATTIPRGVLITIGLLLGTGGFLSFLHLGRKRNAWRAVIHLKKSWLSREILLAGLFSLAWVATTIALVQGKTTNIAWLMALLGIMLIYCMSRVYLLRAVPAWNSWRTPAAFFLSATALGGLGIALFIPAKGWLITAAVALVGEVFLSATEKSSSTRRYNRLRLALLGLTIAGSVLSAIFHQGPILWLLVPTLIAGLSAEALSRWQFYASRKPFPMQARGLMLY
jgi:anaerobic dimethyl sulfoxide reductase subunit B (iron-sulfur subunit)